MIKTRTAVEIQERDKRAMLQHAKARIRSAIWHRNNPQAKAARLANDRRRRGLPEPTRLCPAKCECCGGPPIGQGGLHLDHDHVTGEFRGWLCSNCNTGIGKLGDSVVGLLRAIAYLIWAAQ